MEPNVKTLVERASDGHRGLYLPVSDTSRTGGILSPYFQHSDADHRKVGTGRDTKLFLITMANKVLVSTISYSSGVGNYRASVVYDDGSTITPVAIDLSTAHLDGLSAKQIMDSVNSDIIADAAGRSITIVAADIRWLPFALATLANAPQAAIGAAATNAPTNLNVLTTLLGTLTGEVNATNAKQNDLATKFNTLVSELQTL